MLMIAGASIAIIIGAAIGVGFVVVVIGLLRFRRYVLTSSVCQDSFLDNTVVSKLDNFNAQKSYTRRNDL